MQKPGELQKPVRAGALRKDRPSVLRCSDCGFIAFTPDEAREHELRCRPKPKGDDGPR